jgi:DNA-directed RNA polymerase specialized sigma24 family protein
MPMIEKLFDQYDSRLRARIRQVGVESPMVQEELAQDVWAALAAKKKIPPDPDRWIFTVGKRKAVRHLRREARMRIWERGASELGQAGGQRPFEWDQAFAAVLARLSHRDGQILVASATCRTDTELRRRLGYPSTKIAQTARARVRARVVRLLRADVDVSYMFEAFAASPSDIDDARSATLPEATADSEDVVEETPPASVESRVKAFNRVALVEELASGAPTDQPLFSSFAEGFAAVLDDGGRGSPSQWATALRWDEDDVAQLRSGECTVLELDPDTALMMGDLLMFSVEDLIGMGLADVGLRPIMREGRPILKEVVLPEEEARIRIQALRDEAAVWSTAG